MHLAVRAASAQLNAGRSLDEAPRRPAESATSWRSFLSQQGQLARRMSAVVADLANAHQAPPDGSPWSTFVAWAEDIRTRLATPARGWPADQQREAEAVATRLAELARADLLDPLGATLTSFVAGLEGALSNRSLPEGQLGRGVVIGPLESAAGLAFESVSIVGLTEGTLPPTPAPDPFFPREQDDPLEKRASQRGAEREAFLAAIAAADGGQLTLSTPDSLAGRSAYPSRWMLELCQQELGRAAPPLDAATFGRLTEQDTPWLRIVESPRDAVLQAPAPANLEDRRLREAATWCGSGRSLAEHPLALRPELAVGAGLRLASARRSDRFTAYDGNLTELAPTASRLRRLVDGTGVVSATGLEGWATCPYRYFLERILHVEPTETTEDVWTIGALEKGRLIHGILEAFFRRLADGCEPGRIGCSYSPADVALLEDLAEQEFARTEQQGVTGHPLAWEAAQTQIHADLLAFLTEDASWCRQHGLLPSYFEQPFGTDAPDAWPAVEVPVGRQRLRFRGYIDRVDLSANQARAFVFDYKTGQSKPYADLDTDPVLGGRHLQMALYTRAVRTHFGGELNVGGAYWFVTLAGGFRQIALPDDTAQVDERLVRVVGDVAAGIGAGTFPAVPGDEDRDSFHNCRYCPYDRVCSASRDRDWERKRDDGCGAFTSLTVVEMLGDADGHS
jgi:ATP-dependent helicase/nuclease subunit B